MDDKETRMLIPRPRPTRELSLSPRSSIAKPKIRIIHIFAPEIIMTDTANFRDLVQRLTGKQPDRACPRSSAKSHGRKNGKPSSSVAPEKPKAREMTERLDVFLGLEQREGQAVKEEEEEEQAGGYLKDFADLEDGFTRELGGLQPQSMDAPLPHALL